MGKLNIFEKVEKFLKKPIYFSRNCDIIKPSKQIKHKHPGG